MVVEVGPEIEQLVFEICRRPEQDVIQILASNGADEPFHKRMGQGKGTDAARSEQPGQGGDEMDEKNNKIAHRRIVAGRGIPRNHARINNSPATGLVRWVTYFPAEILQRKPDCL